MTEFVSEVLHARFDVKQDVTLAVELIEKIVTSAHLAVYVCLKLFQHPLPTATETKGSRVLLLKAAKYVFCQIKSSLILSFFFSIRDKQMTR